MKVFKKRKTLLSLLCALALLLSMGSLPLAAVDANRITAVTGSTLRRGETATCIVSVDSAAGLAALDAAVHYAPDRVEILGVYNSVGCIGYDSTTLADEIRVSYLLDGQGAAAKTELFYFHYRALADAPLGAAGFDITVGEAWDGDLQPVAVSGSRCSFTIEEQRVSRSCSVYGSRSVATAVEQEFTLAYRFSTAQLASGRAVITYDPELFRVAAVREGGLLTGKVADIHTGLTGEIDISFVGTEYGTAADLVSVTFRTKKNVSAASTITLKTPELTDAELNPVLCSGYTTDVQIAFDDTYTGDAPSMRLDGSFSYAARQITLTVSLAAGSRLGAGDFVLGFDPALVSYRSCVKGIAPAYFLINDKEADAGRLKFHIISQEDILTAETVLTAVFDVAPAYRGAAADFTLRGTGLTDAMTEKILLNFIDASIPLEYRVRFLDADGTELQSGLYHDGDAVQPPEAPAPKTDEQGVYTFVGWDREVVSSCAGDAVYTAVYDAQYYISGAVTDCGAADDPVTVRLLRDGAEVAAATAADGRYCLLAEPGEYILTADKPHHVPRRYAVTVTDGRVSLDLTLYLTGDVNGDGAVDAADLSHLRGLLLGLVSDTIGLGDANGDGVTDIRDLVLVGDIAAGTQTDGRASA